MYYSTTYHSPVGSITLVCEDDNLVGLWLRGQKYYGGAIKHTLTQKDDMPVLIKAKEWLDGYFASQRPSIRELPLKPEGNEFRREVWGVLCEIPYGELVTYGSIARRIAEKMGKQSMSAQAVGGAVGHNPISIIIPCHRVIGANGSLTGYGGGIDVKKKLLELEGIDLSLLKP